MRRNFISGLFLLLAFMLGGCGSELREVTLPPATAKASDGFLKSLQTGDYKAAEKALAPLAVDDSRPNFEEATGKLKKAGKLTAIAFVPKPVPFGQPDLNNVMVIYAGHQDKIWTTAKIRLERDEERDPFKVSYWEVQSDSEKPEMLKAADEMSKWVMIGSAIMSLLALGVLLLLIWYVRSRPQNVAPVEEPETRSSAISTRNEGGEGS